MKSHIRISYLLVILCLFSLALLPNRAALAQDSQIIPAAPPEEVVQFELLGLTDTILQGPFDAMRVRFSAPPNWEFNPGAELVLMIRRFHDSGRASQSCR